MNYKVDKKLCSNDYEYENELFVVEICKKHNLKYNQRGYVYCQQPTKYQTSELIAAFSEINKRMPVCFRFFKTSKNQYAFCYNSKEPLNEEENQYLIYEPTYKNKNEYENAKFVSDICKKYKLGFSVVNVNSKELTEDFKNAYIEISKRLLTGKIDFDSRENRKYYYFYYSIDNEPIIPFQHSVNREKCETEEEYQNEMFVFEICNDCYLEYYQGNYLYQTGSNQTDNIIIAHERISKRLNVSNIRKIILTDNEPGFIFTYNSKISKI